jgi:putative glutamine amidotransferase
VTPRRRPLIGVTTQTLQAIDGIPSELPLSWVMNQRYVHSLVAAGGAPVLVPLLSDDAGTLREIYDRLEGILVPGGVDIDPAVYREPRHELLGRLDPARDVTEVTITRWALEDQKPFLGLCRGLQVLSVALGGTLWQDITHERPDSEKHDYFPNAGFSRDHLAHNVDVHGDSRLGAALGVGTIAVNSMHHQGIRDLGARLVPTAIGSDGLIEGAELEGAGFAVGVQWHPEMFASGMPPVGKLFEDFVAAASTHHAD